MRILMVEDDEALCAAVKVSLNHAGYNADLCHDGADGLRLAITGAYDILLVDRMLPGLDGVRLITALRASGIDMPVIMITALGSIGDRVTGLDAGADDYLVKPFVTDELLARLRALARRPMRMESAATADLPRTISFEDIVLDLSAKTLNGPLGKCSLSARECELLEMLMRASGQTLPRQRLFAHVWGADAAVEDGNLDSYIHFLRRRMRTVGSRANLKTAYGVGYRLESADV